MRILLSFLLVAGAAWAVPDDREIVALKQKVQAMLDEAALLEQAGRPEDAARVREDAAALIKKIEAAHGGKEKQDDPRVHALQCLEKAIGALEKGGYEDLAGDLRGAADRLRAEIKEHGAERKRADGEGADFWRRNLETLGTAMKGLAEAERHDAADLVEHAIHARKLMIAGRKDEEAVQIMRKSPDDAQLSELLLKAAGCWREFKQPEKAAQCEELGRFFQHKVQKGRVEKKMEFARKEGPGPDDRLARLEERLDRLERMLHETFARLEERERDRNDEREAQRESDRKHERGGR